MLKTLKMFKPTISAASSKSSPRSCLLLKTLLVLLCIYIKRVTSTDQQDIDESLLYKSLGATDNLSPLYEHKLVQDGEQSFDMRCPYEEHAIKIKRQFSNGPKKAKAIEWKNFVSNNVKIIWLKDGGPVHRSNGELLYFDDKERVITFMKISVTDTGSWTCLLNYSHISSEARTYLDLRPAITLRLRVLESPELSPDMKPSISHPPNDLFVHRGSNAVFTCKRPETLYHQTTYWFMSTCTNDDLKCTEKFFTAYNRTKEEGRPANLEDYNIKDNHGDELKLANVSDSDVGYYGCMVTNKRGMDIRYGRLQLFEVHPESTTIASAIPATTLSTTTTTIISLANKTDHQNTSKPSTNSVPFPIIDAYASQDQPKIHTIYLTIGLTIFFVCLITLFILTRLSRFIRKDKKNFGALIMPEPIVGVTCPTSLRQHLPNGDCPDIYNIGKSSDGFISGHLLQGNGHLMSQSICSRALDKENNPSISSNLNSDEASSWGKSVSYQGDNRTLYLHTSNTTTTTVPLYDHPPSTGTSRHCDTLVQDACVINPTYGLLRLESDATDWTFPRRNLDRLNKIGEGQFGEVWRFKAHQKDGNENYVAVKQLKERVGLGDRERLELIAEIEIMKLVNDHPNVIKILHYCADDYEPLLLIMEYAEHGKLQTYLRNCRSFRRSFNCLNEFNSTITSKELIKFSYHIAKGMEYVASKGIVHRDLASRNILVSREKICKVADFGFARRVNDECAYERTTDNPVPVKWMAPEALVENKFTSKSDVFSLGILMWEIVTLGATPYEHLTSTDVVKKVIAGGRLEQPPHCKNEFFQIMASCWEHNPSQRPTFKELAEKLEKLLLSENDYIELDQYPEHAYYNILNVAEKEVVHLES